MSFISNYREIINSSESFITDRVASHKHPKPMLFMHFIPTSQLKNAGFPWELDVYEDYPDAKNCFEKWFGPLSVNSDELVLAFGRQKPCNVTIDVYSNGCMEFVTDGIVTTTGDIGFFMAESFILRALNTASAYYTTAKIDVPVRCFVSLKNILGFRRYMKEGGNFYGHLPFNQDLLCYSISIDDFASILTEGVSDTKIPVDIPSNALGILDPLWQAVGADVRPKKPYN